MVPTFRLSQDVFRNMFFLVVIGPEGPSKPPKSGVRVSRYVQTICFDLWGFVLFDPGGFIQDQVRFVLGNWEIGFPEFGNRDGMMVLYLGFCK
jgi:hypothetical protein